MNESLTMTPAEKKTPGLSEEGKRNLAENITIANKNTEGLLNMPDIAAKLDSDPILKEKVLKKAKFLLEIAIGLGIAVGSAILMRDMGAATSGAEILSHLGPIMGGILIFFKGIWDSNITGSPDVRQSR